jgi:hypothetical protein
MAKVKRSEFKTFLNTGTTGTPIWSLLGEGITTGEISYNPETSNEVYIHQDTGNTNVESYKPTMPVEATHISDNAALEWIDTVLSAAETEICNVWLYEIPTGGAYPAEKQAVSVQFDSYGGEGGQSAKIKFTLNYLGDPVVGTFNPTTSTFVAS